MTPDELRAIAYQEKREAEFALRAKLHSHYDSQAEIDLRAKMQKHYDQLEDLVGAMRLENPNPTTIILARSYQQINKDNMNDPQDDKPSALVRLAMRLYNSGYHAGHHDTVETAYVDICSCDMENYHEETAREIVQNFLGSDITEQDRQDFQIIFEDAYKMTPTQPNQPQ